MISSRAATPEAVAAADGLGVALAATTICGVASSTSAVVMLRSQANASGDSGTVPMRIRRSAPACTAEEMLLRSAVLRASTGRYTLALVAADGTLGRVSAAPASTDSAVWNSTKG